MVFPMAIELREVVIDNIINIDERRLSKRNEI
jgi:hypothetical protein